MKVLGISGSEHHAAAAISVDGSIVAAAMEESFARIPHIGYRYTGGYPLSAIRACLSRAGLSLADIDRVLVVEDGRSRLAEAYADDAESVTSLFGGTDCDTLERELRTRSHLPVAATHADARQLSAVCQDDELLVLVLAPEAGESGIFHRRDAELVPSHGPAGIDPLFCTIHRMTKALGLGSSASFDSIEQLASLSGADGSGAFDQAIGWSLDRGLTVNDDQFVKALEPLRPGTAAPAPDSSLDVRFQHDRRTLAASFCARLHNVIVDMTRGLSERAGVQRVGLTGGLLSSRGLVAAIASAFGDAAIIAPVPEAAGRALGAALDGNTERGGLLQTLALGPEFSESEMKLALENCRLDYLYEPDWSRLIARISRMLTRGAVVAWFQGPMGFGPRAIGTRSILCDPSNRYARENVNRFLRHGSLEDALPVSMTASAMDECLDHSRRFPFLLMDAEVKAPWRDRLRAALDHRQTIPVQMVTDEQSPALFDLLQVHRKMSGVPGLISTTLSGAGEPIACTPREAIRTMFSSAVDALVIGRFLLMKDYWLLRSGGDA